MASQGNGPAPEPDDDAMFSTLDSRFVSEEKAKAKHEEYLQSKITPELLRFFDRVDARELVKYFNSTPSQTTSEFGYAYDLSVINEEAKQFLAKEVKDRKIIELGNKGYRKIDRDYFGRCSNPAGKFLDLGAESYEGCDPKYNTDGLTFLLRQPDESAIVTSFGVLEDGVLYLGSFGGYDLLSRYTAELARQIHRVTPKDAITFHGLGYTRDLENAGFVIEESAPKDLKRQGSWGWLEVLRKKITS